MSNINSHHLEKLIIWQKAVDLACEIYKLTSHFPGEEKFGLTSQMRRSGVSIASNIAEGAGRGYNAQFAQFLSIANGSSNELYTQLIISNRLGLIENIHDISQKIGEIGKMNAALRDKLKNNYAEEDQGLYNINDLNS
jgi:four helix bundle protein